jgi:hypothetical protein
MPVIHHLGASESLTVNGKISGCDSSWIQEIVQSISNSVTSFDDLISTVD